MELYLYLLNKREENELTKAIADNNARIIDPAYGSQHPRWRPARSSSSSSHCCSVWPRRSASST